MGGGVAEPVSLTAPAALVAFDAVAVGLEIAAERVALHAAPEPDRPAHRPRSISAGIDEATLRRLLVDEGLTYAAAAERLDSTVGAVSGLAQRLGILKGPGTGGWRRRTKEGDELAPPEPPKRRASRPVAGSLAERIRALLHQGVAPMDIARELGCNRQLVYPVVHHERKAGRLPPPQPREPGLVGTLPLAEVIERYQGGESSRSLAAATGLTPAGVLFRLRAAKVPIAPPHVNKGPRRSRETAPPGAPARISGDSAGTAAAFVGATGQPLNGVDDVPPLREAGEGAPTPAPANVPGQSDRPIHSARYVPPPPAPGSARDLAAMAAAAVASGAVKVTRCPTVAVAATEGVRIVAEDAAQLRARADAANNDTKAGNRARTMRGKRRYGQPASLGGRAA